MAGRELSIDWNGRRVAAWVPDPLSERQLSLSEGTARLTERAAAAIRRGDDSLPDRWEALARLLLRAEGVASSYVEGVRAPAAEVVAAELQLDAGESAVWVADNTAAIFEAIGHAHARSPLNVEALHGWHVRLMSGASHLPGHLIGAYRDSVGWIGGTSPRDTALVVPPPELIGPLMSDLLAFANRTGLDPVTQAAVLHAQFELIHPSRTATAEWAGC